MYNIDMIQERILQGAALVYMATGVVMTGVTLIRFL
jgi:hypothetical protein